MIQGTTGEVAQSPTIPDNEMIPLHVPMKMQEIAKQEGRSIHAMLGPTPEGNPRGTLDYRIRPEDWPVFVPDPKQAAAHAAYYDRVVTLLTHLEDIMPDGAWDLIEPQKWAGAVTPLEHIQEPPRAFFAALASSCPQEIAAFEQFALDRRYDMAMHPLHYLFLHRETYAARQGWKAALEYARRETKANGGHYLHIFADGDSHTMTHSEDAAHAPVPFDLDLAANGLTRDQLVEIIVNTIDSVSIDFSRMETPEEVMAKFFDESTLFCDNAAVIPISRYAELCAAAKIAGSANGETGEVIDAFNEMVKEAAVRVYRLPTPDLGDQE
jgi:hypothetical protein